MSARKGLCFDDDRHRSIDQCPTDRQAVETQRLADSLFDGGGQCLFGPRAECEMRAVVCLRDMATRPQQLCHISQAYKAPRDTSETLPLAAKHFLT